MHTGYAFHHVIDGTKTSNQFASASSWTQVICSIFASVPLELYLCFQYFLWQTVKSYHLAFVNIRHTTVYRWCIF